MGLVNDDCTFGSEMIKLIRSIGRPLTPCEKDYDLNDPDLYNPELCKACGGRCCRRCGCFIGPRDFRRRFGGKELTLEAMRREIEKGYFVIERVDLTDYYRRGLGTVVRMRNIDDRFVIIGAFDVRPGSPCVMWDKSYGCKLSRDDRPIGGRLMVPSPLYTCSGKYGVIEAASEWLKYEEITDALIGSYRGVMIPMPDSK